MATTQVTNDTLITLKLQCGAENKRTKLPLRDLVPGVLPGKLRTLLALPAEQQYIFERFSDSAGSFIKLDDANTSVYKQLHRAAKAKLKLRIRITAVSTPQSTIAAFQALASDSTEAAVAGMTQLRITNPTIIPAAPSQSSFLAESMKQTTETVDQRNSMAQQERTARDIDSQLRGLHSYLNDFQENMAQDYTNTFGSQLPSFLDAPAEPDMPRLPNPPFNLFSVCCNNCNFAIPDHHYHCGICEEGDFDLCQQCLDDGNHCNIPDHFLVKRSIENGKIVSSTTESYYGAPTVPKVATGAPRDIMNEVPGAFSAIQEDFAGFKLQSSRTCNSCISIYDDSQFVTCNDCDDFDLCISCHIGGAHGHHPAHTFAPATDATVLEEAAAAACEPGRGQYHHAVCDGCDQKIHGIRHKCLDCPDFDYCSGCHKSADFIHAGHRFVPIYEPLEIVNKARPARHYGIRCDGPLCGHGGYISGVRYKCAICHDTDFCANCEALPTNPHNRTHPLIKFKTPIRGVNVETREEAAGGGPVKTYGDRSTRNRSSRGTETIPPAPSAHASTQAEAPAPKPEPELEAVPPPVHVEDVNEAIEEKCIPEVTAAQHVPDAYYVRDHVPDGTKVLCGKPIFQTWTMYNPSGNAWPVGTSLRWVGGDQMLDVDTNVPGRMSTYENAASSNATVFPVPRGSEHSFSIKLRAPEKLGRAVSYWRLYTPEGTPFGHRLWCDILVVGSLSNDKTEVVEFVAEKKFEVGPAAQAETETAKELSESQMVFPKLDKESPASSTYVSTTDIEKPAVVAPASPIIAEEDEELLSHDDVESVTVDLEIDDDETEDGFFTDEEYDMVEEDVHH